MHQATRLLRAKSGLFRGASAEAAPRLVSKRTTHQRATDAADVFMSCTTGGLLCARRSFLIQKAFGQITVDIDAPVAQEGPMSPGDIHLRQVDWDNKILGTVHGGFGQDLSAGAGNKTLPPKFQAI